MSNTYSTVKCSPPINNWGKPIRHNLCLHVNYGRVLPLSRKKSLRAKIIEKAVNFTNHINTLLQEECGFCHQIRYDIERYSADRVIAMTGHQPVICHPGVFYKYKLLNDFVRNTKNIGISIIIDTDQGEGGKIPYPVKKGEYACIEEQSIVQEQNGLYFNQKTSTENIVNKFDDIEENLQDFKRDEALGNMKIARYIYEKLHGRSIIEVNTAARRVYTPNAYYLDIPLSAVMDFPETRIFFAEILKDYKNFHNKYNKNLNYFRQISNIKNHANPCPDLKAVGERKELPFWVVDRDKASRTPLFFAEENGKFAFYAGDRKMCSVSPERIYNYSEELPENVLLAPRAILTSVLLQYISCDLFIHGLGGSKYDQFTDLFVRDYFNVVPPQVVVASGDAYLFKDEVEKYNKSKEIHSRIRELYYHTEKNLDDPWISPESRVQLEELAQQKKVLVEKLQNEAENKKQRADFAIKIKEIDDTIQDIVNRNLPAEQIRLTESIEEKNLKTYFFREYPFFFFNYSHET